MFWSPFELVRRRRRVQGPPIDREARARRHHRLAGVRPDRRETAVKLERQARGLPINLSTGETREVTRLIHNIVESVLPYVAEDARSMRSTRSRTSAATRDPAGAGRVGWGLERDASARVG
jgi:hypothetical protein